MEFNAWAPMVVVVSIAVPHVEAVIPLDEVVRQEPSLQTFLQMRSALAGAASNIVAVKTAAAVPMSVIERMFDLLCGVRNNNPDRAQFLKTRTRNLLNSKSI
jgi:hypothetical protein